MPGACAPRPPPAMYAEDLVALDWKDIMHCADLVGCERTGSKAQLAHRIISVANGRSM